MPKSVFSIYRTAYKKFCLVDLYYDKTQESQWQGQLGWPLFTEQSHDKMDMTEWEH